MTGLLIKDIRLMKAQKTFFIALVVVALVMAVTMDDSGFVVGYLTCIGSIFTISTISYDEFDNGGAFLFSLPISKKSYVQEKYLFGLMTGGCAGILGTIMDVVIKMTRGTFVPEDILVNAYTLVMVFLLMLAVMIPIRLKFGAEKGNIGIAVVCGGVFAVILLGAKLFEMLSLTPDMLFGNLPELSDGMTAALMLAVAALIMGISYSISLTVMNHKEY